MPEVAHLVVRYERNTAGRDFVVGDIHGCFLKLQQALDEMGFKPHVDRLFSVGDLVDRGPDSDMVLEWLDKPWFHPVRGNHDNMAIKAARGQDRGEHWMHGGYWLSELTQSQRNAVAEGLDKLPYAIEVETAKGLVGVIHADAYGLDWAKTVRELHREHVQDCCTWSRERVDYGINEPVAGLVALYVGHSVVKFPIALGNVHYVDTGAVFNGAFTIAPLCPESEPA